MAELSLFQWFFLIYFTLVFVKTLLCYSDIFMVLGVLNRRFGRQHQVFRVLGVLLTVPVAVTLTLPKLLAEERLSFFVTYRKSKVMRDMLNGF